MYLSYSTIDMLVLFILGKDGATEFLLGVGTDSDITGVGKSQSGGDSYTLKLSSDIFRTVIGSEDRLKVYLDIRYLDISYVQNCDRL